MLARRFAASAASLLIALVIVGCGGGSDSLSKAEFIKQADVICEKADKTQLTAMGKVQTQGNAASRANQEKLVLEGALPAVQREAEEIADLGAPAGDENEVAAIVRGIEEAVTKAEENPINGLESAFAGVDKRAAKYGFKACSEAL